VKFSAKTRQSPAAAARERPPAVLNGDDFEVSPTAAKDAPKDGSPFGQHGSGVVFEVGVGFLAGGHLPDSLPQVDAEKPESEAFPGLVFWVCEYTMRQSDRLSVAALIPTCRIGRFGLHV
jgi:hypothetical protein